MAPPGVNVAKMEADQRKRNRFLRYQRLSPKNTSEVQMSNKGALLGGTSWSTVPSKKTFPKVDTSNWAKGVGVQKSGYALPPVKLPGLTEAQKNSVAKIAARVNAPAKAPPGRAPQSQEPFISAKASNTAQGLATVLGPAIIDEIANLLPDRSTAGSNALKQISPYASMIPGVGQYAYLLSSLGGPLLDFIITLSEQAAKNNVVPGLMNPGNSFAEYAEFMKNNPDAKMTLDQYVEYKKKVKEYEQSQGSCRKITKEMLGDMTLEEYAQEMGIEFRTEETKPPTFPKYTPEELRQPTQEEINLLQNARLQ